MGKTPGLFISCVCGRDFKSSYTYNDHLDSGECPELKTDGELRQELQLYQEALNRTGLLEHRRMRETEPCLGRDMSCGFPDLARSQDGPLGGRCWECGWSFGTYLDDTEEPVIKKLPSYVEMTEQQISNALEDDLLVLFQDALQRHIDEMESKLIGINAPKFTGVINKPGIMVTPRALEVKIWTIRNGEWTPNNAQS